jgi:hypothetical protein
VLGFWMLECGESKRERVSDFPRTHRFRLAQRIENAAFGFHERLLWAARASTPKAEMRLLSEADVELDKLRFYTRLAAEVNSGSSRPGSTSTSAR